MLEINSKTSSCKNLRPEELIFAFNQFILRGGITSNTITYQKNEGMGMITSIRPKSMNSINGEFISELDKLIYEMAKNDEIVNVIITGSEKVFCLGADIKEISGIRTKAVS